MTGAPVRTGAPTESVPVRSWESSRSRDDEIPPRLTYLPALDGLRGVLLVFILLYHAGYPALSGAVLSLSVFFTLSGYLITRLLLDDAFASRSVDLARFYTRRLRRLMPAALATIGFVLVLSATVLRADPDRFRLDALWTLGYGANWRFIFSGRTYADLFVAPSPLLHFWSLAIEEQFYLLFPLVVMVVVRASAGPRDIRRTLRWVLMAGIVGSLAVTLIASGNDDFVYYSLPTRAAEILMGGLLATSTRAARLNGRPAPRWVTALGIAAIAAIATLYTVSSPTSRWVLEGGLPLFAVLSAVLIFTLLPDGPLSRFFAIAPFRDLGRISYGMYLYHWPIILWLTPERIGLPRAQLTVLQLGTTLAFATASYFLLEGPIRYGRRLRGHHARLAAPVAIAGVAVATIVITATLTRPPLIDFAATADAVERATASSRQVTPAVPGVTTAPRVAFFGDSTALLTSFGVIDWANNTSRMVPVDGQTGLGCGIVRTGLTRNPFQHFVAPSRQDCGDWGIEWPKAIEANAPDVAVVMSTMDVADHKLPGDGVWRGPGDAVFDELLTQEMLAVVDLFSGRGVTVVWLTIPHIDADGATAPRPAKPSPESNPARVDRVNQLVRQIAIERPELRVVDLAGWMQGRPEGELDPALRPDGAHFTTDTSVVVAQWLGPAILRAVRASPLDAPSDQRGTAAAL